MADKTPSPVGTNQDTNRITTTQLRYPQLLIEASFESLLSHSQSSGTRTAVPMPHSDQSLSESWSSLSEPDFSHDDDLQSEATDTGSLIDVNTTEDIHSVDDHGDSSDADDDSHNRLEEYDGQTDEYDSKQVDDHYGTQRSQTDYVGTYSQESIRLENSTVVVAADGMTSLQASKSFTEAEMRSSSTNLDPSESSTELIGIVKMSMSPESLKHLQRPYHILYYGSALSSSEIKSEVLGKIGAALICAGDEPKFDDKSDSPCYHIVPSEFGPGSRPITADLIPIPTQMHISDCTVPDVTPDDASDASIHLHLSTGKDVISRQAGFRDIPSKQQWAQPDLAVIVVSQNESEEGRNKARKVIQFANRHQIAVICLRQEAGWDDDSFLNDAIPHMLHKVVQPAHDCGSSAFGRKMLLDVDLFLALDTEQLNQHLNYLRTSAAASTSLPTTLRGRLMMQIRQGCRQLPTLLSQPFTTKFLVGEEDELCSSNWTIEASASQIRRPQHREKRYQRFPSPQETKNREFILAAISRAAKTVAITAVALFMLYASQTALSYLMSTKISAPLSLSAGEVSAVESSSSTFAAPVTASAVTIMQVHAVSGPLQVLEQQVQSWMPTKPLKGSKNDQQTFRPPAIENGVDVEIGACQKVVSAHIRPNLKVDPTFFSTGDPFFSVRIRRGDEKVMAKIEKQSDGTADIMIKRKDLHGQLTVYLDGVQQKVCASIDLHNSIPEALTLWIHNHNLKPKAAKKIANRYTRLLEVRTTKPGLVSFARELQYSAGQGLGAAVEAVERTAVKQTKVCHNNKDECFTRKFGAWKRDVSGSVQHARHISEDMMESTRKQISETTHQARNRANKVTEQAKEEISRAVQVVQSSIGELSIFRNYWPGKVTETLAEAQDRAHKLVKRSRTGRKKGRKSA